ncbi:Pheromone shutdown, TraB family-containing protein [Strongyloides ratti]|uniref:Pheromone shutdown, TraB family-containing protein n=1 Tax=Strongyloides ratti TaxID=34506 RepID=A0A090KTG9_STRRB|nr:Pheromone shutdown, TraB family-containing protein [Strongyloides ratti]CEF60800.1 Pheromone shutdown, TraB family-containing protein [Strongyloides ratti]
MGIQEILMSDNTIEVDSYKNIYANDKFEQKKKQKNNYKQPFSSLSLTFDNIPITFNNIFPPNILKYYTKGKIILIGTGHFLEQSKNDVREVINSTIPDGIFVELCRSRIGILNINEKIVFENTLNPLELIYNSIKQEGLTRGLVSAILISYSNELMKKSNCCPGGEFRIAFNESKKIKNSIFGFCDRNIEITLNRLCTNLTFIEKLRLLKNYLLFNINNDMEEKLFDNSSLYHNLSDFTSLLWKNFPTFKKIMVDERDQYMATILLQKYNEIFEEKAKIALDKKKNMEVVKIVAVVGYGHIFGIKKYFGKEYDIDNLNSIYIKNNKTTKSLHIAILISIIGGVILSGYYILNK